MKRAVLSADASNDLLEIKNYLREQFSAPLARSVNSQLREAVRFLARWPRAGHLRQDLTDEDVLFWPTGEHVIIYGVLVDESVVIYRILHGARDIASILARGPLK